MTDRPIIFSAPMVRALLDGRKTQTRRVLKNIACQPDGRWRMGGTFSGTIYPDDDAVRECAVADGYCAYAPGDRLWVRENCWTESRMNEGDGVRYPADGEWRVIENSPNASEAWCVMDQYAHARHPDNDTNCGQQVPSIHMPRWASRLTLHVEAVRVQRLQDISAGDAIAEGVTERMPGWFSGAEGQSATSPRAAVALLWNSIHGPGAWDANPWVVAITFRVEHANIAKARGQA